ncbi:hypothetical protein MGSAQ_002834, partial [marine sediment metagenome]
MPAPSPTRDAFSVVVEGVMEALADQITDA